MPTRRDLILSAAAVGLPLKASAGAPLLKLETVCQLPRTGNGNRANINGLTYFQHQGLNVAWDARGPVYRINGPDAVLWFDVRDIRPHMVNYEARYSGVRWVCEDPASPSWLYISTMEFPAARPPGTLITGPYPNVCHASVFMLHLPGMTCIDLLNVSMYSFYHPIETLTFRGGSPYKLFACVGDGGYVNEDQRTGDTYEMAQNPASPLGKVIYIDLTRPGSGAWRWYAKGLRHPEHLNWLPDGRAMVADIGALKYERIIRVRYGVDYGWSQYEGDPPAPFGRPSILWDRRGINTAAICGGPAVTTGPLAGNMLFGDIITGRMWAAPLATLGNEPSPYQELNFQESLPELTGSPRVDLRLGHGPYNPLVMDKLTGSIRRIAAA